MQRPGFRDVDRPRDPARVGFEQVCDDRFRLLAGFTYVDRRGGAHHVFRWHLPCTDLTSIPRPFRWFEGRHGRHTLAALLHDQQVTLGPDDAADPRYWRRRTLADDRFLESLGVLGVPWVRRHLMWSAVHFITRLNHHGFAARVATLLWAVLSAAGTYLVVLRPVAAWLGASWPPDDVSGGLVAVAALAPVAASLALWVPWGQLAAFRRQGHPVLTTIVRRWWCGVVMGYGVLALAPTGLATSIGSVVPWLADRLTGGFGPSPWSEPCAACDDAD